MERATMEMVLKDIKLKLQEQNLNAVRHILEEMHSADIAELLEELESSTQKVLFRLLDGEKGAEVINEVDESLVKPLLEALDSERTTELFEEMSLDDAADLIAVLPEKEQRDLFLLMESEDVSDLKELLEYGEDTAGGIMTTEYIAFRQDISVDKAIESLRESAPVAETVYYLYVIDEANKLVGVLSLRELIVAAPQTLVSNIMHKKIISVNVHEDQEEVARVVTKYNFLAVPVVDDNNELLGIITVDDIIDVIHEEATEDIYRLAGTQEIAEEDTVKRIKSSLKARLPWLFITMIGGMLSGSVLSGFETTISQVVALTFFIPLLMGMGGNVGTQSSTLVVRGLATGNIDSEELIKTILKESLVGISIGIILGFLVSGVAYLWQGNPFLGFIVGLAMFFNVLTAATIGTLVPLVFKRLGVDPAVASAPFISTTVDVTGLLIYATLTTVFIGYF